MTVNSFDITLFLNPFEYRNPSPGLGCIYMVALKFLAVFNIFRVKKKWLHTFDYIPLSMPMEKQEFEFSISGKRIQAYRYPCKDAKAMVVLLHGMGEHAVRYERTVVPAMLKASFMVVSFDQFGHGRSEGKRGHHKGFELLLDSVDRIIALQTSEAENIPVILYGHSMGGNVAVNYALRRPGSIDRLVLTSPFLRLAFDPPSWKLKMGEILLNLAPGITMSNELDTNALSRDPEEIAAYERDSLVHDRVSPAYSVALIATGEWAISHAASIKIPTLIVHGNADRITSHEASKEFVFRAGIKAEYLEVDQGYHELHHDLDKINTMNKIIKWMINKQ